MANLKNPQSILIAFIGGGNMATALIGGLIGNGANPDNVLAIDPTPSSRDHLSHQFKVRVANDCNSAANFLSIADLVIFAVKPQQFKEAAEQFKSALAKEITGNTNGSGDSSSKRPLILSIAAGIRLVDIIRWIGYDRIVRGMPNTPALIGQGVTGLCSAKSLSKEDQALVEMACSAVGQFVWVEKETQIDAVTAVSGSGPAYVFSFLEALQAAGESQGLSTSQARILAIETLVGSAALAAQSEDSPTTLREKVTSKGGTTFAALEVLREKQWSDILKTAIDAAAKRGAEMGEEFGKA